MEIWQLKQMQSLDLEIKIKKTKLRIKEWLNYWNDMAYLSFSGGKDSTVLMHLVKSINEKIPIVFCNTGIQFPEVKDFVYSFIKNKTEKRVVIKYGYKQEYYIKDNFIVLHPKYNFKKVIKKYGYPVVSKEQAQYINLYKNTNSKYMKRRVIFGDEKNRYKISKKWKYLLNAPFKISDKCCKIMKIRPFIRYEKESKRVPFIGTLVGESSFRLNSFIRTKGCNSFNAKRPMSKPLSFWTEQDILRYIKIYNLRYSKIYGEIIQGSDRTLKTTGRNRTGCIFCAFGAHLEEKPNRFQRMKHSHPKLYKYCIRDLGMSDVLKYINVPYK
ncbi:MAG: phosphoadenosine phosphosulfate reductase family protein [bacterium]